VAKSKNDNTRYRKGMGAEWLACALLFAKNYRIIARRWRTPMGEIDILAAKDDTLILVEVKYRRTITAALESVSAHQQQRLMRAANYAAARYPRYAVRRWDMIAIAPWAWPQHIVSVWAEG
jgi:putative endonuclease